MYFEAISIIGIIFILPSSMLFWVHKYQFKRMKKTKYMNISMFNKQIEINYK